MRWYYDDPLAASWMAKHYGMKLQFSVGHNYTGHIYTSANDILEYGAACFQSSGIDRFYYIHPDSLNLLEIKEKDYINDDGCLGAVWKTNGKLVYTEGDYEFPATGKIIQREGIPFMWPKKES